MEEREGKEERNATNSITVITEGYGTIINDLSQMVPSKKEKREKCDSERWEGPCDHMFLWIPSTSGELFFFLAKKTLIFLSAVELRLNQGK